jgi:hypothetical protein
MQMDRRGILIILLGRLYRLQLDSSVGLDFQGSEGGVIRAWCT